MLLREIFSEDEQENITPVINGESVFLEQKLQKYSLSKSIFVSLIAHILVFLFCYIFAKILVYILLFLGIDLDLFKRPALKVRDIEFVFVLPDKKYDLSKSFLKNSVGKSYSMAGPEPNNRAYNNDKGSLKSSIKDNTVKKDKIVNSKPIKATQTAASQTTKAASKLPKKGDSIPKIEAPGVFDIAMPDTEMNTNFGFGAKGESGIHSPSAGNVTFKAAGEGSGGIGEGDSLGDGTVKGGGYYYGSAGAPRPQTANAYKNEALDVDLRPYVTELQRRVLRNWVMPSNDNTKKTVLFLRIAKSGNLMILNVKTPSGDTYTDEMAIQAVKKAQPFSPLPTGYSNSYADIILTFDYNVSAKSTN